MKTAILLLAAWLSASSLENYTCTPEQLTKARKEFKDYYQTVQFQEEYDKAIRKYCKANWREFLKFGTKEK